MAYFWYTLIQSSDAPRQQALTEAIDTYVEPDDIVMTNLRGKSTIMPLEFYAYHNIQEDKTYADALDQADESDNRVIYVHCVIQPPPETEYETIDIRDCQLIFIE